MPPEQQQFNGQQPPQGGPQQGAPVQGTPGFATNPQNPNNNQQSQDGPSQPNNPNSTQNALQLSEIRDNMVIMADGSFRAAIVCKSINFDLMNSRERDGIEFSYQNFLNSLNHPVQIVVRSQRVDIGPYIDKLVNLRRNQDNMLLNVLMDDYINFIDILSEEANIMDKQFYVIIPYYSGGDLSAIKGQTQGFFSKLFSSNTNNQVTKIDSKTYQKAKDEIKNRVDGVMAGLFQMGVQSIQLNTKELGELYYNFYNPDTAVREPLGDFDGVTAMYVRKGQESNSPDQTGGGYNG